MVYGVRVVSDVMTLSNVGIVLDVTAVCGVGTESDVGLVQHMHVELVYDE